MNFNNLDEKEKRQLLNEASIRLNLDASSIEKDWWVTSVLKSLFDLPYSDHLSLKGGTSLSKCWGLINRFSEDIDIAVDREYLGFEGNLSKNQISDKLRRAACAFVRERMCNDLKKRLITNGLDETKFKVSVNITPITTTDPEVIEVMYVSCLAQSLSGGYIMPKVKIEVSGRSMSEPIGNVKIGSLISKAFDGTSISDQSFLIRAVLPERTFLEKVFLLHEEFSKGETGVRVERMSRHMYDIYQMINTVSENAISDETLYRGVIEHRRKFIGLKGFDYDNLYPGSLNIVPNNVIATKWKYDYDNMKRFMISGDTPTFEDLIDVLVSLNARIRRLPYKP